MDQSIETFTLDGGESAVVAWLDFDQLSVHLQVGDQVAALPPEASRAVRAQLAGLATGAVVHVVRTDGELPA